MTQSVDLYLRGNNQHFFLPVDVRALASLYDLADGVFRMQVRASVDAVMPLYSWSSDPAEEAPGTITYDADAGLVCITASYDDVRAFLPPGAYPYDWQWESDNPVPEYIVMDLWSGTLNVSGGVTLR